MSDDNHLPARRQALPLFIGLMVSALMAVVAVRCSSRQHGSPPAVVNIEQAQGGQAPVAAGPAEVAAERSATLERVQEPGGAGGAGGAVSDAGTTTLGRLMQVTDKHDRAMLADIERKAKQRPSNSVYRLLELRRAGKSRADLERFIQTELDGGITVRLTAMKWLRAINGEPEPAPSTDPLLRQPGEPDAQPRTVKPLTKTGPQ
jgi:hypothetical protein